jgi:hypothetical protein
MEGWKRPWQPLKLSPFISVVIVVESRSTEGTMAATKAFPCLPTIEVKVVESKKVGKDEVNEPGQ